MVIWMEDLTRDARNACQKHDSRSALSDSRQDELHYVFGVECRD